MDLRERDLFRQPGHAASAETANAIDSAEAAWPGWRAKTGKERAGLLRKWFELMMANQEDLARIMTIEQIKLLVEQMRQLGAPEEAGAYHQKFQEASDTDLESLLQDLRVQCRLLKSQKDKGGK